MTKLNQYNITDLIEMEMTANDSPEMDWLEDKIDGALSNDVSLDQIQNIIFTIFFN